MERPIILKAHEVRGILDGRQTQLRRVVKNPQNILKGVRPFTGAPVELRLCNHSWPGKRVGMACENCHKEVTIACPYGDVGDRLWGKETFTGGKNWVAYRQWQPESDGPPFGDHPTKWKPSTVMPRWASRILLEIVSVRVERLQDISEADAEASGAAKLVTTDDADEFYQIEGQGSYQTGFYGQWCHDYGSDEWGLNPWVWVVEFKRVDPA